MDVDLSLWIGQVFLALFFLGVGAPKVVGRGIDRWTGFDQLPRPMVVVIGVTEVLGAAGLVLPMATHRLPWLTPLAALGLGVTVLMAAGFHLRGREPVEALESGLWAALCALVVVGRFDLVAPDADRVPGAVVVSAQVVLTVAVLANLVVLLRRRRPAPA
jgi:hypothetical protein